MCVSFTHACFQGYEGESLQLWDVPYWAERQAEALFEFEAEALRPYFALDNVLTGKSRRARCAGGCVPTRIRE